jgi:hypothetical protein
LPCTPHTYRADPRLEWYLIGAIAITLTVLITTQHDAVVHFCAPVVHTIRAWPGGWLIPIVLLIIVSYPPLVGHESESDSVLLTWKKAYNQSLAC